MAFTALLLTSAPSRADGTTEVSNLSQSESVNQAAQNYLDQSNAAFAQSAMATALGLAGMKAYCNPGSGSGPAPAGRNPVAQPATTQSPGITSPPNTATGTFYNDDGGGAGTVHSSESAPEIPMGD